MATVHVRPTPGNTRPRVAPYPVPTAAAPAPAAAPAVGVRRSDRLAGQPAPPPAALPGRQRRAQQPGQQQAAQLRRALIHIFDQGGYEHEPIPGPYPDPDVRNLEHPGVQRHSYLWRHRDEISDRRQEELNGRQHLPMESAPPGPPRVNWQRWQFFGAGGYGIASGYVARDTNGDVLQRIVVKDCMMDTRQTGLISTWAGKVTDPDKRTPVEIESLKKLYDPTGEEHNTCQLIYANHDVRTQLSTIIMQEADQGNLHDIHDRRTNNPYPEPFIWAVAYGLLKGAHQMRWGTSSEAQSKRGWNKEIVHRDIKSANILLSRRDPGDPGPFRGYPHFSFADFGCAVHTSLSDPLNPQGYLSEEGTPGAQAPEQLSWNNMHTLHPWYAGQQSEKTNIWGIGLILMSCLHHNEWGTADWMDGPGNWRVTNQTVKDRYTKKLIKFVEWFLRGEAHRRPNVAKALRTLRWYCDLSWDGGNENDYDDPSDEAESNDDGADDDDDGGYDYGNGRNSEDPTQGMWGGGPITPDDRRHVHTENPDFLVFLASQGILQQNV